jgi:mono/diheme cytochrome c family protein
MRTPTLLDRAEDLRHLDRHRIGGLMIMAALIVAFPIYSILEPARLEAARAEIRTESIDLGRELYTEHCASCHGEEGLGGGMGPTLASLEFLGSVTDRQMQWLIAAGSPGTSMPAYYIDFGGPLTDEELNRLVVFLRSLEESAASVPCWRSGILVPLPGPFEDDDSATVQVVECESPGTFDVAGAYDTMQIYQEQCADCHGVDGKGTEIAGSLRPMPFPFDKDLAALRQITRDGLDGTSMLGFALEHDGPLDDAEIEALSRWLQSPEWKQAFAEPAEY